MMSTVVLKDDFLTAKLLVTGVAYLILMSIGLNNTVQINAKEIAMNITNTHTSSATKAELFFDKQVEKEKWNKEVALRYPNSTVFTLKDGIKHIKMTKYINARPIRLNIIEVNTKLNENLLFKPVMADNVLNKRINVCFLSVFRG